MLKLKKNDTTKLQSALWYSLAQAKTDRLINKLEALEEILIIRKERRA